MFCFLTDKSAEEIAYLILLGIINVCKSMYIGLIHIFAVLFLSMKKATKRLLYIGFLLVLVIAAACGTIVYCMLYMSNFNITETKYVYIDEDNKDFGVL